MATNYPGAVDSFVNPTATDTLDSATVPHAAQHDNINDAMSAVQVTLGVNPQGSSATVVARLTALDSTVAGKAATNQTMYVGTTALTINRSSASQTLTGVSVDGNAGTVTNGVYTNTTSLPNVTSVNSTTIPASATLLTDASTIAVAKGGTGATATTGTAGSNVLSISPALTGTPTAPTAAVDTNTTQIASTAFVLGQASTTTPVIDGTATIGTATTFARADHKHPTDTTRATAGANSDITSLTGLTTALSVGQGGTGQITLTSGNALIGAGTSGITTLAITDTGGGSSLVKTGANGTIQAGTNITVTAGVNPTAGSIGLKGASSGTLTLQPSNSTFGDATLTLPTTSGTVALVDGTQTLTNKTISGSSNSLSNIAASAITSVNGSSIVAGVATITGTSYTVGATDYLLICNNSATLTITLPTASSYTGRVLKLVKYNTSSIVSASSNVGSLTAGTAQNTFFVSNALAGRWCEIISNGTVWQIVGQN